MGRDAAGNDLVTTTDSLQTRTLINSKTFTGSNATVVTPIFRVTGSVEVIGLWGVVTTDIGVNHTASAFRLNDQTAQLDITLNTGSTLSSVKAGSAIVKKGLAASAVALQNNSVGRVSEPTAAETMYFSPFLMLQKTGGVNTDIEYVYATTDTPTTGAMQFFVRWRQISNDGNIVVV